MRIVMVAENIGDAFGQEKVIALSTSFLRNRGHQVFFIGSNRNSPLPDSDGEILIKGLFSLHTLSPIHLVNASKKQIIDFVEQAKPDVIHITDQMDFRLMKALCKRTPSVMTAHTVSPTCPASHRMILNGGICNQKSGWTCLWHHRKYGCLNYLKNDIRRIHAIHNYRLKRKTLEPKTLIIAISRYIKDVLAMDGWPEKHLRLVFNPVPIPQHIERLTNTPENLLVCASRLVTLKGIDRLLMALKKIENFPWSLWICGSGPMKPTLVSRTSSLALNKRVVFLGTTSFSQTQSIIASSQIFIQPNIGPEGFGLSAAEASAMGIPVIASNLPALNEIIEDRINGLLAQSNDIDSLARCLKELLENPVLRDKLGRNGPEYIKNKFSTEQYLTKLEGIYQEHQKL